MGGTVVSCLPPLCSLLLGKGRRHTMRTLSYEDREEGKPGATRQQGAATNSHTSETEELQPQSN